MNGLIVIVVLFALFWLLLLRPQRRRQQAQERLLASIEVGDEVVTAGGLYGDVLAVEDDEVRLEIAPGVEVRVARRAIAAVLEDDDEELDEDGDEEDAEDGEGAGVQQERATDASDPAGPGRES